MEERSKFRAGLWCRDAAEYEAYERRLARSWAEVRTAAAAQVAEEAGAFWDMDKVYRQWDKMPTNKQAGHGQVDFFVP